VKAAQLCIPIVFLLQSLLPLPLELSIECRHTNRHSHNCCKRNWQYPARHFVAPFPGSCVVNGKDRVRCMMISPAEHLSAFFPPPNALNEHGSTRRVNALNHHFNPHPARFAPQNDMQTRPNVQMATERIRPGLR
jgi:hypothetical protein